MNNIKVKNIKIVNLIDAIAMDWEEVIGIDLETSFDVIGEVTKDNLEETSKLLTKELEKIINNFIQKNKKKIFEMIWDEAMLFEEEIEKRYLNEEVKAIQSSYNRGEISTDKFNSYKEEIESYKHIGSKGLKDSTLYKKMLRDFNIPHVEIEDLQDTYKEKNNEWIIDKIQEGRDFVISVYLVGWSFQHMKDFNKFLKKRDKER